MKKQENTETMNDALMNDVRLEAAGDSISGYEAPRIISHSAEHLEGMTIDVNACNSAFGGRRSSSTQDSGSDAVTY